MSESSINSCYLVSPCATLNFGPIVFNLPSLTRSIPTIDGGISPSSSASSSSSSAAVVVDIVVGDSVVEDSAVDDSAVEDSAVEDSVVGDSVVKDSVVDNSAVDVSVVGDSVVGGSVVDDSAVEDSAAGAVVVEPFTNGSKQSTPRSCKSCNFFIIQNNHEKLIS